MAAEKKPRAVVLGVGYLVTWPETGQVGLSYGDLEPKYLFDDKGSRLTKHDGEHGTLLWLPDPPKPTKRGRR
jgi:hypothetical protein